MKNTPKTLLIFILLILTSALYRVVPAPGVRPFGFEPMIAIAIFGGAVIANKKWAFAVPLAALLLSDGIYEALTRAGVINMPGFYRGQWINYIALAGIAFFGIRMKSVNAVNIGAAAIMAPLVYFIVSNTGVWIGGGGYAHPHTFSGWAMTMTDGLPFLKWSLFSSLAFSALFFGGWYALNSGFVTKTQRAAA